MICYLALCSRGLYYAHNCFRGALRLYSRWAVDIITLAFAPAKQPQRSIDEVFHGESGEAMYSTRNERRYGSCQT